MAAAVHELDAPDAELDACLCHGCRRLVTGRDGDFKVCVVHGYENLVFCAACFWSDERREAWLEWRTVEEPIDPWLAAFGRAVKVG
jgi:hypothetical protein